MGSGELFAERSHIRKTSSGVLPHITMQGLTIKSLRSHYALIPLFISVGAGAVFATFYLGRLALKNPDATWDRKNNPYPWTRIKPDQNIKFYAPGGIEFSKLKSNRPEL